MRRMVIWFIALMLLFLRHALPVVIKGLLTGILLMINSLISLWQGVMPSINKMADEWTEEVRKYVQISQHEELLYRFFQGLAALSLVIGWVLSALITVWLLRLIF